MLPMHHQRVLHDRERELRRLAERERRRRAEGARADPYGMDDEIRVLVDLATPDGGCPRCGEELADVG